MNIYDIAELAGVSIATVSRVVNDSPLVSEKTKAKVRKVMEENNYTPNVFARGLGLGTMKTIGIVCPDVADAYMAQGVAFIERNLRESGYDCILQCSGKNPEDAKAAVTNILNEKIDALFLIGSFYMFNGDNDPNTDYLREAAKNVPVFLVNGYVEGQNIYGALCDDKAAVEQAVNLLISEGRKHILFLYNTDSHSSRLKREGYIEALNAAGLPVDENLFFFARPGIEDAKRDLLRSGPRARRQEDGGARGQLGVDAAPGQRAVQGHGHRLAHLSRDAGRRGNHRGSEALVGPPVLGGARRRIGDARC